MHEEFYDQTASNQAFLVLAHFLHVMNQLAKMNQPARIMKQN